MVHRDALLRPRLGASYRLGQGTLAGMRGNARDAPIPDLAPTESALRRENSRIFSIKPKRSPGRARR
jgi:hypothetical protein